MLSRILFPLRFCGTTAITLSRAGCVSLTIGLAGCGNLGLCRNKCDPPLVHDSFCGCVDWSKKPTPGSSVPYAGCICQYSSGVIGAWFPYKPAIYPETNRNLTVFASGCSDLTVCDRVRTEDGERSTYITGRVTIAPTNWVRSDNLIYGGSVWALFGRRVTEHAYLEHNYTPINMHAVKRLTSLLRMIENAAFHNTIDACRAACNSGSPYCITTTVDQVQTKGLLGLQKLLIATPSSIPPHTLLSLFHVDSDPCGRTDTVISDGKIENKGDACDLAARADVGGAGAVLSVPGVLSGNIKTQGSLVSIEFPFPETRAQLHFSDNDLDADWGGDIKSAYADESSAGFAVGESSCVRVRLK